MQKLKIYIAGPMSGITNDNRDAFHRQAELLHRQDYCVLNLATLIALAAHI